LLKLNNNSNNIKNQRDVRTIEFFSATLGGFLSSFISSPIELCMIQQQLNGGSIYLTLSSLINKYGYQSIMKGCVSCILRDSIYVSGMLGVTPIMYNYFINNYQMNISLVSFD